MVNAIEDGADILRLAAGLLRLCHTYLDELSQKDSDTSTWRQREALRLRCEEFFTEVDDEELDPEEREELLEIASAWSELLPPIVVARTIVEALDSTLGSRLLPMFLNRRMRLRPGDPVPTPHPDWRRLILNSADSHPHTESGLDAISHLRLAGEVTAEVEVILDGDWRRWHILPQLDSGDRLACATPNRAFSEIAMERAVIEGRSVFYDARFGRGTRDQETRCLQLLELAAERGCRLVAFPEHSVSSALRQAIQAWLDRQDTVEMVVAGSCHVRGDDGHWQNEAAILFRGVAEPIVHRKFRPYSFVEQAAGQEAGSVRHFEHLTQPMPRITAHLSPHWTLVLLVCNDLTDAPIPQVLTNIGANLVLVPALCAEMDAFRAVAASVAASAGIAVIANACISTAGEPAGAAGSGDDAGAACGDGRPPLIIGISSPQDSIISQTPPPLSLLIVTIGSLTGKPSVATINTP